MLSLESPLWTSLQHAYGVASDTPELLRQLSSFPDESTSEQEPWFSLWSSLCHQGDVFSASFAAVPHIVAALVSDPKRATMSFFLLPASIELARQDNDVVIPPRLEADYLSTLARLPDLVGAAAQPNWEPVVCSAAVAAIAAATGNFPLARLVMQIDSSEIPDVLEWFENR